VHPTAQPCQEQPNRSGFDREPSESSRRPHLDNSTSTPKVVQSTAVAGEIALGAASVLPEVRCDDRRQRKSTPFIDVARSGVVPLAATSHA
jgi:hypothetical protein